MKRVILFATGITFFAFVLLPILAGEDEVEGFAGIPVYAGAECIFGTEAGETKWAKERLAKEGYIWYEFGKKLTAEYNKDAVGVDNRIVDFYKKNLAQKGWKYIGKGVRTHHWAKGQHAVGISFPADCTIEYRRMSLDEASGNCGQLGEDKFPEAFMACARKAQEVSKEQGVQKVEDYYNRMADEESLKQFNGKIEVGLNQALKPYGVTFKRFKEIKEGFNFDEMMGRIYGGHEKEMEALSLGLAILTGLLE